MATLTYDPKQQFLGSLAPASSMKTTTASTTQKSNVFNSPVVSASPSATQPKPPVAPASSTPAKSQYVASLTQGSAPAQTGGTFTTPSGAVVNAATGALVSGPSTTTQTQTTSAAPSVPPPTTQATAAPEKDGYQTAFEAYIRSLTPTPEEDEASKYLRGLLDTSRREEAAALERGETLGFATGEAARVNKARAFDIQAASEAVDALSNRRGQVTSAQQARMDYEKTLRDDARADKSALAKDTQGFSVSEGEKRYEYDDATKQYKLVATGGAKTYAPSSTNPTASEKKANSYASINQLIKPGVKDVESGVPYVDQNGYITPTALKALLEAAAEDGIDRKEFLAQYGAYLWPGDDGTYSAYALTLQDKKALTGL